MKQRPLGSDRLETQGSSPPNASKTQEALSPKFGSDVLPTQRSHAGFQTSWHGGEVVLGRFRLRGLLGRGGMSEVWEALDLQTASGAEEIEAGLPSSNASKVARAEGRLQEAFKIVALKCLRPSLFADASARKRFLREIEILRRLDHPQIVRIDEAFPDDLCFTMERLEGQTLRAYLAKYKRLPLLAALILMEGLIGVLQSVHAAGIIHRDLKPDNLFLCETTEPPENPIFPWKLKLLDFGIALSDEGTHLTKTQAAGIGTAYYIAPEQLEGSHHLTAAVDVYALGILLYNLLTGRIYQAHAPSISEGFKTLMMERRIEQAEKHRDIDWNASLHLLDTAFEKAVAFDSKQRPSLSAFLGSIREAKEMFQKKRKKCSERLWLAARSKLSEQPASEVFAEFRKNVLPAFPERTDFLSWLEVWHEAEKLATALQEEPVSPVQTLRADWKKAKKKSACPFVYDEHPFATNVLGLSASPRPQVSFESLENEEIPEIPPSRLPKPRVSRPPKRTLPNHFSDVPFTNIPSVGVPARNPPKFVQDLLQLRSPFFEIAATIACVLMVLGWAVFLFLLFFLSGPLTPVAWGSILGSLLIGGFSTWAFYRLAV